MAVPTQRPGSSLTYLYPIITCPKMFHFPIPYSWSQNGTFLPDKSPVKGFRGVLAIVKKYSGLEHFRTTGTNSSTDYQLFTCKMRRKNSNRKTWHHLGTKHCPPAACPDHFGSGGCQDSDGGGTLALENNTDPGIIWEQNARPAEPIRTGNKNTFRVVIPFRGDRGAFRDGFNFKLSRHQNGTKCPINLLSY